MKILDRIFGRTSKTVPANPKESAQTPVIETNEKDLFLKGDVPMEETGKNQSQQRGAYIGVPVDMQRIGYPIDVIYSFINRDYFRIGYHDALVNGSKEYADTRQSIIRNDLKTLFLQVNHTYNEKIGNIEERIEEAESNMLHSVANRLRRTLAIYNEHVATIRQMEEWLDSDDPRMTKMLASYQMGHTKGFIVSCGTEIDMTSAETYSVVPSGEEYVKSDNSKTA